MAQPRLDSMLRWSMTITLKWVPTLYAAAPRTALVLGIKIRRVK